jgi:stage II sporulation protein M
LLIQGESVLIFWGNNQVLWLAVLGVILVTALLIRLGLAHFQREVLLGREIDVLNLRLMGGLFWKSFSGTGQAPLCLRWLSSAAMRAENSLSKALLGDLRGFFGWYTGWVFPLLRKMRTAIFIVVLIGLMTSGVAFWFVTANFSTSGMGEERVDEVSARIGDLLLDGQQVPLEITSSWLFLNNSRVALVILFLGMFSFGVAGVLVYILNLSLVGAVLGAVEVVGLSWLDVLVLGILPHGIFELPAIVLVSAGVLYMGTRLVTPNPKESIGEVVIETLAEWMVIAIGLAFPLLLIAALVEANITPILLYNLFENSFFAGS